MTPQEPMIDIVGGTPSARRFSPLSQQARERLRNLLGPEGALEADADLQAYAYDGTFLEQRPDFVALPRTTEEVAAILRLAGQERVPVVTRGAGSGLAGGSVPLAGGIALVLTRMNRIIELDPVNMLIRVQPGVVTADLHAEALAHGLFYPPDPASQKQSTIGGNVAMCAGGPHGLKYGVTKDYVLGLEAVTADGRVMRTGGKMIKNVTGYNLTQLLVGSEGTLAVITEILLRLLPKPKATRTAMAVFPRIDDAARMITVILNAGIIPATIEIMDQESIRCVEEWQHAGLPIYAEAILLIELDGEPTAIEVELTDVARLCRERGAEEVRVAADAAESAVLWSARRSVSASMARIRPTKLGEDISVPRSAIPDALRAVREIAAKYGLQIPVYGHISDGNLHPNILFDRHDPEEVARVNRAAAEIFAAAVRLGGTLTGEHGIGSLKKEFLASALDPVELEMMHGVKRAFDPHGILNPGKVFPSSLG
ncbi:MAG TPA: FAD-linked oxidase C-terminal domain-containing protein [Chloroflexota bacterium]|nr:FAD-linked oxidase C-terminal domain-containing protein [Chloroflexota bacterium]